MHRHPLPDSVHEIATDRLLLRWFRREDAGEVQRLCGDWTVLVGLARLPWPYPDGLAEAWISSHGERRAAGLEYSYAITHEGALIGSIGLTRQPTGDLELGYWIGRDWWGAGFASEAAAALRDFGFGPAGQSQLVALHTVHNAASGHVLRKVGFERAGTGTLFSRPLNQPVRTVEYLHPGPASSDNA